MCVRNTFSIAKGCFGMKIERDIISQLAEWKDASIHKPVLIKGARQIGKTWVMHEFGRRCFKHVAEFNFDRVDELHSIFAGNKDINRIIKELSAISDVPIIPGETLIIFDEIQESEHALNCLKYFCEDAPEYHVVAAGSLLGVAVRKKSMTVPVGKVRIMRMYPMSFSEYLRAADLSIWEKISQISRIAELPELIFNKLMVEYRRYMVCGGMPEAALAMINNEGKGAVDNALQDILDMYELDFSKYASPIEVTRINAIWRSLPSQLSKENRKFVYNVVRSGARARDYEDALIWLEEAGLIYKVQDVSKPGIPLSAYCETNAFKVYASDCGLLRRMARIPAEAFVSDVSGFTEFKGAMAENAVLLSLIKQFDTQPYYWTSGNMAEVDFVVQMETEVVPIEVKSERNTKSKSLSVYNDKYKPNIRIRYSANNLKFSDGMLCCPLPMADFTHWLMNLANKL